MFHTDRVVRAVVIGAIAALAGCAPPRESTPWLDDAVAAGRWLQAAALASPAGRIPDIWAPGGLSLAGLGDGAAGRLVFFLELYHATADSSFLRSARREADIAQETPFQQPLPPGLYNGWAGIGYALHALATITQDTAVHRARRVFDQLARSIAADTSLTDGSQDVLGGTAGIGFALLAAARAYGDTAYLGAARTAGEGLLRAAEPQPVGWRWPRWRGRMIYPSNFSTGTAGIGAFLATLAAATGDTRFLAAAESAAAYLDAIADRRDGLYLVPVGTTAMDTVTRYGLGWAHGTAGTARLWAALRAAGAPGPWDERDAAAVRTLVASGVPGMSSDTSRWQSPFPLNRLAGLAGVIPYLLARHEATGDTAALALAQRAGEALRQAASRDANGLTWQLPPLPPQGDSGRVIYTGYLHGMAGIGLALLELHYRAIGAVPRFRLPDDPWPAARAR